MGLSLSIVSAPMICCRVWDKSRPTREAMVASSFSFFKSLVFVAEKK